MEFFRELKENLEKNDMLYKIVKGATEFIGELTETLIKGSSEMDIVTQIGMDNKLTLVSENEIDKARTDVLKDFASSTKDDGDLYFIFNKVKGEENYRVWKIRDNEVEQTEINKSDLPNNATVNAVMRKYNNEFIVDECATKEVESSIRNKANEIIKEQNRKIEDYKKEGHTYLVTADTNGRVFLCDSTEKPKYEIEDLNFPEELKDKAKEGNSFLYKNGRYEYVS